MYKRILLLIVFALFVPLAVLYSQSEIVDFGYEHETFEEKEISAAAEYSDDAEYFAAKSDDAGYSDSTEYAADAKYSDNTERAADADDGAVPEAPKRKRGIKNRGFELAMGFNNVGFSNSFIGTNEILQNPFKLLSIFSGAIFHPMQAIQDFDSLNINVNDAFRRPIEIDLDDLLRGIKLDAGASVEPLSININWKDKWGFGFDIGHIDVTGNLTIPEEVLGFREVKDKNFGAGLAAFVDFGIPVFFHVADAKVKFRPSAYLPIAYAEPNVKYSYTGTSMKVNYDIRLFMPVSLDVSSSGDISMPALDWNTTIMDMLKNNLGYDFSLGLEYPLFSWLHIGVDFINIPVPGLSASLNDYLHIEGEIALDYGNIDIPGIISDDSTFDLESLYSMTTDFNSRHGSSGRIRRPFKMLAYASYQPFEVAFFKLLPVIGFSYNRIYPVPGAFEGGLTIRLDFGNCYILDFGWNYMDRKWKNSINSTLNLRLIQFDSGIIFQSSDFVKSWQGAGFAFNFGIKMGW